MGRESKERKENYSVCFEDVKANNLNFKKCQETLQFMQADALFLMSTKIENILFMQHPGPAPSN